MNQTSLKAMMRDRSSRGDLRRMRLSGRVPGVVYGKDEQEPIPVSVDAKDLHALLRSHPHAVLELDIWGLGKKNVLLTEVQRDSLNGEVLHLDFHKINMNEAVRAPVRLELSGKSAGEKEGGMLQLVLHELEVECLPKNLPDSIVLDVADLQVGDSLTVADVKLPGGVKPLSDPDTVVASVLAPQKGLSAEEADAQDDAAEEHENQAKSAAMMD